MKEAATQGMRVPNCGRLFFFLWRRRDSDGHAATLTAMDNAALGPRQLHRNVTDGTRLWWFWLLAHPVKEYRRYIG